MAKTKKQRLEMLRKQLEIRKGIAKANAYFCRELAWEIAVLERG